MPVQEQVININFSQGLDQKTDPWQVPLGKFLDLQNAIFDKGGLLTKRDGFGDLAPLPDDTCTTVTTYLEDLVAIGNNLLLYSENTNEWITKGAFKPISLSVLSAVRGNKTFVTVDTVVASNLLVCCVCVDSSGQASYQIIDSHSGQVIVSMTNLTATAKLPRVFYLDPFFIITYLDTIAAVPTVRYIVIPIRNVSSPLAPDTLNSTVASVSAAYDGVVCNGVLYVAFAKTGNALVVTSLTDLLNIGSTITLAATPATYISLACDDSSNTTTVWLTYWASGSTNAFAAAYNQILVQILAPTQILTSVTLNKLTCEATAGVFTALYEVTNTYSFTPNAPSDYVSKVTCTVAGVVGTPTVIIRSLGLASKAFFFPNTTTLYFLGVYGGAYQPTYFLVDSSGNVVAKIAYSNGAGYLSNQILPSVSILGNDCYLPYLIKTLLSPVNKAQGASSVAGIYAQVGINIAKFSSFHKELGCFEIANTLHITGGFLWMYDGVLPVEHGFHLWPEDVTVTTSGSGGLITAQKYYYYVTYEWTDAQGNLHRSAPSVPMTITTTGTTSTNTINIPTLRLTYKVSPNPVRIVIYRWSQAQQIPYQITSVTSPTLNDPTADSVTYTDTVADGDIVGNTILYTNGGEVENIAAPACSSGTLYKSRLLLIPSESPNNIWFSKQVLQGTPIEMNDLFTIFTAPTFAGQQSTGPNYVISALDDKVAGFKKESLFYWYGTGPDNKGNNNDFTDPLSITSTVGSDNPKSIVLIPKGIMFQSYKKGIWLLERDLNTSYIGAPVDDYKNNEVISCVNNTENNQVRFNLDNGTTLVYDYYYDQWDTFTNVSAISSTMYDSLQTYITSTGTVRRETPGVYLDGYDAVLISFTTGWINAAGLQGYERAKYFYLLGKFISPHKLYVQVAYDYDPNPVHSKVITPINTSYVYGDDPYYGSSTPYGGLSSVEQNRFYFKRQKCEAFRLTIREINATDVDYQPGEGLTLSGIALVIAAKKGYPILRKGKKVQSG